MSEQGEFFTYTREEFVDEFVHPDDLPAVQEARDMRALKVRAEYLTEMRKKAWLMQADAQRTRWSGKRSDRGGRRSSSRLSARRWAVTTTKSHQLRTGAAPGRAFLSRPSPCGTRSGKSTDGFAIPTTALSRSIPSSPSPAWPASPCSTASRPGTALPSAGTSSLWPESGSPTTSAPPERQPESRMSSTPPQQHGQHSGSRKAGRARHRT